MADISITAANVISSGPAAGAVWQTVILGATLTAGESVYIFSGKSGNIPTVKACNALGSGVVNQHFGILLTGGGAGQAGKVVTKDAALAIGGTVAAGAVVVQSGNNAGGIAPAGDLTTGWFATTLGVGIGSNKINYNPNAAGVAT